MICWATEGNSENAAYISKVSREKEGIRPPKGRVFDYKFQHAAEGTGESERGGVMKRTI